MPTGHLWSRNYASFWIDLSPDRGIDYRYNGGVIYHTDPIGTTTAASVVVASDNRWPSNGEFMDLDEIDYGWMPEPATLILVLCGVAAMPRRSTSLGPLRPAKPWEKGGRVEGRNLS